MKENCAIKVEGAGYGIIMSSDENKLFGGRIGKPKVAICPKCGEVLHLDEETLLNDSVDCPKCGEPLEFEFDEDDGL